MAKYFGQSNLATTGNAIIVTSPSLFCNYFLPDNRYTTVISGEFGTFFHWINALVLSCTLKDHVSD